MSKIEEKLRELGLEMPPAPPLGGVYHPVVVVGKMMYVSGQPPLRANGTNITGIVGKDMSMEAGKQAAQQTGLTMLATIKAQIHDLDRIKRLVKTLGMVNCEQGFIQQPQVINGFSELMVQVLGDELGKGARSAVGMILPGNIAVEIEAIFELNA
jgi:enamine deaminase RidA (YjgF/YER057c/UK114 family)